MPDAPYSAAGLRLAEAEMLRRFSSIDDALAPANQPMVQNVHWRRTLPVLAIEPVQVLDARISLGFRDWSAGDVCGGESDPVNRHRRAVPANHGAAYPTSRPAVVRGANRTVHSTALTSSGAIPRVARPSVH